MTPSEREYLASFHEVVDVWRGCYEHNRGGFSWSADREIAIKFLTLNRYRHDELDPLLLHGRVRRADILFVKIERKEQEIVPKPGAVELIEERKIPKS